MIRFLKYLMNVLWYGVMIFGGLLILAFIILPLFVEWKHLHLNWWYVYMDPCCSVFPIEAKIEGMEVRVIIKDIFLVFSDPPNYLPIAIQFLGVSTALLLTFGFVGYLRKIVFSVSDENPFCNENVVMLRKLAYILFIWTIFEQVFILVQNLYAMSVFEFRLLPGKFLFWELGLAGEMIKDFNWTFVVLGIIILVLAEIFKKGMYFKEDSSSII
ncbi:MAG: DUF2975 domain-containing protein [Bacteroidetes bacterium]|nr:DUF2975 domain-containing protein [Bacteroidota bacterium]